MPTSRGPIEVGQSYVQVRLRPEDAVRLLPALYRDNQDWLAGIFLQALLDQAAYGGS